MIVVDASVWVRALVDDGPLGESSRRLLSQDSDWAAPGHAPIEVLRTIKRYESVGLLGEQQANVLATAVSDAEVRFTGPERWLLQAVWERRHNVNPYDAPYLALAVRYGVSLVTLDERLARAARAAGVHTLVPARE